MRTLLILFLIFPMLGQAQSDKQVEALKQYLIEEDFFSKEEAQDISTDYLFLSIYKRYNKSQGYPLGGSGSCMTYGLPRIKRPKTYKAPKTDDDIERLINKVFSLKLIDTATYSDLVTKFEGGRDLNFSDRPPYGSYISTLYDLWVYLAEKERQEKNKPLLSTYLDQLNTLGLIEKDPLEPPKSRLDILNLFQQKLVLNRNELPDSIAEAYKYAFEQMEKLVPGSQVTDLHVSIEPFEYSGEELQSAVIRFSHEGIPYTSYLNDAVKVETWFYEFFNKILTEQGAEKRLFHVNLPSDSLIYLLLLDQNQFNFLKDYHGGGHLFFDPYWYKIELGGYKTYNYPRTPQIPYWYRIEPGSHISPHNLLSRSQIEERFTTYDSIGLFSYMNDAQKREELQKLQNSFLVKGEPILYRMKDMHLEFDWTIFSEEKPFKNAVQGFAAISHGEFNPTNFKDKFPMWSHS
ncbi:MAG: hypothetical protein AAGI38_22150 [Bacteroidota bacterium]